MFQFNFHLPTRVHFAQGIIEKIGEVARSYGKKALLVTGRSSARRLGFLQKVEQSLKQAGINPALFEKVEPNPSINTIEQGASFFKQTGCSMIIALGGGSPLDAAKLIGVLATNPGPVGRYFGKDKVKNRIPPVIALPTTSGTGSEVTPYAVVTDTSRENHPKKVVASPYLFPTEALLDPNLTAPLPASSTSDTGIDALSHAIESILSKKSFPLSETIAFEAVRTIGKYLPRAIHYPQDMKARSFLMYASMLGGMAITHTGATLLHSLGYPLTSMFNLPHGRANGLLFPWFWEKTFPGSPEKFSRIVSLLVENVEDNQTRQARGSSLLLKEFLHKAGLPHKIDIDTDEKTLSGFATEVIKNNKRKMEINPKKLSFEEVLSIYREALA